MEHAEIVKSSITRIDVGFERSNVGLKVTVKVHEDIERLLMSWGTGEQQPVIAHGRHWLPVGGDPPLKVHQLTNDPGNCPYDGGYYNIRRPGQPLVDGESCVNLAILRLVGASDGAGIAFNIKGVYELDKIRHLAEQFKLAGRRFYSNFMKPVNIHIMISTQEMRT